MDGGRRQRSGGSRSLLIKGERLPAEVGLGGWGGSGSRDAENRESERERGERQADEIEGEWGGGEWGGQERQFNEAQSLCHL